MAKLLKFLQFIPGLILSFVGLCIIAALILLGLAFWDHHQQAVHAAKVSSYLAKEIPALPVPSGCHESHRSFSAGGVYTEGTWYINYTCDTTGGEAYDTITGGLQRLGFTSKLDDSKPQKATRAPWYDFIYANDAYTVSYSFQGPAQKYALKTWQLPVVQIAGIEMSLKRTPQS